MKNSPDKNGFDDAPRARESLREGELEIDALTDSFAFDAAGGSELKSLLESWRVPAAPPSLRARVAASYREQFSRREEKVMNSMTSAGVAGGYAFANAEYHLTILEDERLLSRLAARVREVARESELTWPELRRDPVSFARRLVAGYALLAAQALGRENVGYGLASAFGVLLTIALGVAAAGGFAARRDGLLAAVVRDDLEFAGWIEDVPKSQPTPEPGAAGFAKGAGGGMKQKFERPGGGGGGGRQEDKPAVGGKLPPASLAPQVLAPDPHPPAIRNPQLPTQATIRADPTLFPPDPRPLNYGDPKSSATELSSGSGKGGGIGDGDGGGVGSGAGAGYGPGEGFNTGGGPGRGGGGGPGGSNGGGGTVDYHRIFRPNETSRRAQVISRPEPLYTEEARRNQIVGTVTLRLVLNADGTVTNITALSRLPDGLTERAIEAARRIRFAPAEKDGRKVSQYATIQYNFNIY